MAKTIAISGKGGSGKTTLTALIIRCLIGHSKQAILAVDADANSCLGITLGVTPQSTVSDLRDDVLHNKDQKAGVNRLQAFEYGMHQLVTEAEGFDLLTMGRPEGPKCYCAVNNILRKLMDDFTKSYGYMIIDNEAGMEHLSRRTTNKVDLLIIVAEPTNIGMVTARRIIDLCDKLPITVNEIGIIWNKIDEPVIMDGVSILGCIPQDKTVVEAAMEGKTIFDLEENCPAMSRVRSILKQKMGIG